jgi:hypothetical protein
MKIGQKVMKKYWNLEEMVLLINNFLSYNLNFEVKFIKRQTNICTFVSLLPCILTLVNNEMSSVFDCQKKKMVINK